MAKSNDFLRRDLPGPRSTLATTQVQDIPNCSARFPILLVRRVAGFR
jgi:hypothetical protein